MHKSFYYAHNTFEIASNLYLDFGVHIPLIRSFSLGINVPPQFPFFSSTPLSYHFFFDFLIGLYEKLGVQIDVAINTISALTLTGVILLLYSFAKKMTGKKSIGMITVVLFLTSSTFAFVDVIKKYWGDHFFYNLYHHNIYLSNGPFGDNIVSIFWSFNTYLNQRHLLFGIGILLLIVNYFTNYFEKKKSKKTLYSIACLIGILPLWNTSIFIAAFLYVIIIFLPLFFQKKELKNSIIFVTVIFTLAIPQLLFIKLHQTIQFPLFHPGFLTTDTFNIFKYWFFNLGISCITIPLGFWLSKGKVRKFFLYIALLFLIPNLFQFSPQIFDNHKFLNIFILFGNMFSAYLLYFFWQRKKIFKTFAIIVVFLLTLSGIFDFLVVKNDTKIQVADIKNSSFHRWLLSNTKPTDIFLTDQEIYDPITLVGRKNFIARTHVLWTYAINPYKRLAIKDEIFYLPSNTSELLKKNSIKYIAVTTKKNKDLFNTKAKSLKRIYKDSMIEVFEAN